MNAQTDYIHELIRQVQSCEERHVLQLLADAADAHPGDARPLLLLAAELMERRELDRAEAAYVAALQRAPDFWIARFQLGLLQFTSARPAVAMVTWAPLEALEETNSLRIFKEAFERLAKDDLAGAAALISKGIAANTINPPLNRDMEMLLERIVQQQGGLPPQTTRTENAADAHFFVSAYKNVQ